MNDLEEQLRRALGSPPPDDQARQRALTRLRAEMAGFPDVRSTVPKRSALMRMVVVAVSLLLVAGVAISISGQRAAVASELEALAIANQAWRESHGIPPLRIDETYLKAGTQVTGGPGYTIKVHAEVTRSVDTHGAPTETKTIVSAEFASEADQQVWESMGSPTLRDVIIGEATESRLDRIYNLNEVSTDPAILLEAIESGKVTASGYQPTAAQQFGLVGSLLLQPELNPDQRAALYSVVGSLDGVELMGEVTDPVGRAGVGFSRVVGSKAQILIFDEATGLPLAALETPSDDPSAVIESLLFNPPS